MLRGISQNISHNALSQFFGRLVDERVKAKADAENN